VKIRDGSEMSYGDDVFWGNEGVLRDSWIPSFFSHFCRFNLANCNNEPIFGYILAM